MVMPCSKLLVEILADEMVSVVVEEYIVPPVVVLLVSICTVVVAPPVVVLRDPSSILKVKKNTPAIISAKTATANKIFR